ncbi:hypothetical protein, partial [Staphylococcus aureus]|uniref:hypothetical protein n=1 Tax=Staphylococcus aureus TaxID=1280 RepID=UPI00301C3955
MPEPVLPDDEPASAWPGASLRASREEATVAPRTTPEPEAPRAVGEARDPGKADALQPPDPEQLPDEDDDESPRLATAEQAREATEEEGMRLWTVEHLQNQRPAFNDMPEPEGELPSLRQLTPPEPHQPNFSREQLAEMAE